MCVFCLSLWGPPTSGEVGKAQPWFLMKLEGEGWMGQEEGTSPSNGLGLWEPSLVTPGPSVCLDPPLSPWPPTSPGVGTGG